MNQPPCQIDRAVNSYPTSWTAPDPIGDAGGDPDWYGYCLDDPVNANDPMGLFLLEGLALTATLAASAFIASPLPKHQKPQNHLPPSTQTNSKSVRNALFCHFIRQNDKTLHPDRLKTDSAN